MGGQSWGPIGVLPAAGALLLLDALSVQPIAAFSSKKLRAAYAGNAMTVTKASGGSQAIGFSGNFLDETALTTFVGGATTGSVTTWNDQSLNGSDATVGAFTAPPVTNGSGVPYKQNNHIAVNFDRVVVPSTLGYIPVLTAQPITIVACITNNATPLNHIHDGISGGPNRVLLGGQATQYQMYADGSPLSAGTIATDGSCHTLAGIFNSSGGGAASQMILDGTTLVTGNTTIGTSGFTGSEVFTLGCSGWGGFICELLVFNVALGATDLAKIRADWIAYWGAV